MSTPPAASIAITSDGVTLDILLSATPNYSANAPRLSGLLDTGADILVVDESLKPTLVAAGIITESPPEEDTLNGEWCEVWQVHFWCKQGRQFSGLTKLTFMDLRAIDIQHDALVGRSCLEHASFQWDGPNGRMRL